MPQGLFGPDSVTWRINRESVLLLGGGRALLLQAAHPHAAADEAQHWGYHGDPWRRLVQTLGVTRRIVFGDTREATRAGSAFESEDHELLLWVWATQVESSLLIYTRYVGPLKVADVEAYYVEQKRFLAACGVPAERAPETFAQFMHHFDDTVDRVLEVTPAAREVAAAILRPRKLPLPLRPVYDALNLATVGLLPPTSRERYGLGWGVQRERLLGAQTSVVRRLMPLLPSLVRELPDARSAGRRLRASG
jgi:uncharacterized protein (DUF2236 family)